jgi:hypothetical protein
MGVLERSLEEDVARRGRQKAKDPLDTNVPVRLRGQEESHSDQEDDEDTKQLNISSFVTEDAAYYDDEANLDDEILDLGISIGKMRVTERIGGLVRPRFAEEVNSFQFASKRLCVNCCSLLKHLEHYHQANMPNPSPHQSQTPKPGWRPVASTLPLPRASSSLLGSRKHHSWLTCHQDL